MFNIVSYRIVKLLTICSPSCDGKISCPNIIPRKFNFLDYTGPETGVVCAFTTKTLRKACLM